MKSLLRHPVYTLMYTAQIEEMSQQRGRTSPFSCTVHLLTHRQTKIRNAAPFQTHIAALRRKLLAFRKVRVRPLLLLFDPWLKQTWPDLLNSFLRSSQTCPSDFEVMNSHLGSWR
jgi:hypothetical protein